MNYLQWTSGTCSEGKFRIGAPPAGLQCRVDESAAAHLVVDLEAQLLLQRGLADGLPAQVVRREGRGRVRVGRRVPLGCIHAIRDAIKHMLTRLQHAVQAPAALRRCYLPCVPLHSEIWR